MYFELGGRERDECPLVPTMDEVIMLDLYIPVVG